MVEIGGRYFDPRFFQFGLTALILKFIVYYIQSHLNPTMNLSTPDVVTIKNGNSSASIHLFGATLVSWIADGQEVLFVSKKAVFDGKKAIRGGVPVVFPQFGPWDDRPQHGFARISRWTLKDEEQIGTDTITLVLEDSEATRTLWNHRFRMEYTLQLINSKNGPLKMDIAITNLGEDSFSFTFLWHTYFSVPDVLFAKISGLSGCTYIDKVKKGESFTEEREDVSVSEFTDRVYTNTRALHRITNVSGKRIVTIDKFNLPDTVVWNPWIENAKSMSDFGDDEWKNMICVEAGVVNTPVTLDPKNTYAAAQVLSVDSV